MRNSVKEAIVSTIDDMQKAGLEAIFTKKELDGMGIDVTPVSFDKDEIKTIRKTLGVSQSVFAKLLNVSLSAVRQWEQGMRKPSGSTMILLELLQREPGILDYRIDLGAA